MPPVNGQRRPISRAFRQAGRRHPGGELLSSVLSVTPAPDHDSQSDADLVTAVQEGDRDAFAVLYERHHDAVLRSCTRRIGDRHDAEEVTQAAFVRALERIDQCQGDRRFGAWVQTIAFRLATDLGRSRARSTPAAEPMPLAMAAAGAGAGVLGQAAPPDQPEDALLAGERRRHLAAALAALPARQLEVLRARDVDGHGPMEIAASMGVTVGTIDSVLLRARRRVATTYQSLAAEHGVATAGTAAVSAVSVAAPRPLLGPLRRMADALAVRVGDVTNRLFGVAPAGSGAGSGLREVAIVAVGAVVAAVPLAGGAAAPPSSPLPVPPPVEVEVELDVADSLPGAPVTVPALPAAPPMAAVPAVPAAPPTPSVTTPPVPTAPTAPAAPAAPATPAAPAPPVPVLPTLPAAPAVEHALDGTEDLVQGVVDAAAPVTAPIAGLVPLP